MHPFPDAYCELNAALNTRGGKREWSTVPAPERSWSGKGNRQGSRQPQYRGISVEEPQKYKSGRNPELAIKKTSWKISRLFSRDHALHTGLNALVTSSYSLFPSTLGRISHYYPHFLDEEAEAWQDWVAFPRWHHQHRIKLRFEAETCSQNHCS